MENGIAMGIITELSHGNLYQSHISRRENTMKIFEFKKRVEIKKTIGNIHLDTFNYVAYENGKRNEWTELSLWYDRDCEHCPCGWEHRSYEGECEDCGCLISKDGDFSAPTFVCMLPSWIKNIIIKIKRIKVDEW